MDYLGKFMTDFDATLMTLQSDLNVVEDVNKCLFIVPLAIISKLYILYV